MPETIFLSIEDRCNLRCSYCDIWETESTSESEISIFFRIMEDAFNLGAKTVVFTGGEPLLNHNLGELIRFAVSLGLNTRVITNGLLLSNSRIDLLIEAGLSDIAVSIDSLDPYIFKRHRGVKLSSILANWEAACLRTQNLPVTVTVVAVVSAYTVATALELARKSASIGSWFAFQWVQNIESVVPHGLTRCAAMDATQEHADVFQKTIETIIADPMLETWLVGSEHYYEGMTTLRHIPRSLLRDFHCSASVNAITVDRGLMLRPCWRLPPIKKLDEVSLASAWQSEEMNLARERITAGECPSCWLLCYFAGSEGEPGVSKKS